MGNYGIKGKREQVSDKVRAPRYQEAPKKEGNCPGCIALTGGKRDYAASCFVCKAGECVLVKVECLWSILPKRSLTLDRVYFNNIVLSVRYAIRHMMLCVCGKHLELILTDIVLVLESTMRFRLIGGTLLTKTSVD